MALCCLTSCPPFFKDFEREDGVTHFFESLRRKPSFTKQTLLCPAKLLFDIPCDNSATYH